MNAREAEDRGYTVDRSTYPWVAYRGRRFDPIELFVVDTPAYKGDARR